MKTRLSLTGPLVVARDIAHAKIKERLDAGEEMPQYLKDHPVYYAGPAKTPEGFASGSFGPTTAGRMDSYVEQFQAAGGSMVMLAKGNRSKQVTQACDTHGGFYLGSIGGPAARLAQDCIKSVDVLEYAELGMEAVWKIEVEDFPAFIVVDDKGNDFFTDPSGAHGAVTGSGFARRSRRTRVGVPAGVRGGRAAPERGVLVGWLLARLWRPLLVLVPTTTATTSSAGPSSAAGVRIDDGSTPAGGVHARVETTTASHESVLRLRPQRHQVGDRSRSGSRERGLGQRGRPARSGGGRVRPRSPWAARRVAVR